MTPSPLIVLAAWLLPASVLAHAGAEENGWWSLDPWTGSPMLLMAAMYLRGVAVLRARGWTGKERQVLRIGALAGFSAGMLALFLALTWPLDALGETSFAAHMAQHMMLIAVAAPLFALARPFPVFIAALPAGWRRMTAVPCSLHGLVRILLTPSIAFALHGALIWAWHVPFLFELALRARWVHVLEHVTLFGSALLFWFALCAAGRRGTSGCGSAALWTFGTLMHTGLLGALITLSPRLLYGMYAQAAFPQPGSMEDQQLAGLLMWIPGSICYLVAGLGFAAAWTRGATGAPSTRAETNPHDRVPEHAYAPGTHAQDEIVS